MEQTVAAPVEVFDLPLPQYEHGNTYEEGVRDTMMGVLLIYRDQVPLPRLARNYRARFGDAHFLKWHLDHDRRAA